MAYWSRNKSVNWPKDARLDRSREVDQRTGQSNFFGNKR